MEPKPRQRSSSFGKRSVTNLAQENRAQSPGEQLEKVWPRPVEEWRNKYTRILSGDKKYDGITLDMLLVQKNVVTETKKVLDKDEYKTLSTTMADIIRRFKRARDTKETEDHKLTQFISAFDYELSTKNIVLLKAICLTPTAKSFEFNLSHCARLVVILQYLDGAKGESSLSDYLAKELRGLDAQTCAQMVLGQGLKDGAPAKRKSRPGTANSVKALA